MRTKAKGLLLSIMLLVASCVFFACKEQTKINVESIAFTEQSISLLVGEEYTPEVKVLPSYASNRSYTLISNDSTAISIDGGTITALRAVLGVKLKVVSNENENINDVLSVNIYNEPVELEAPTDLQFDGEKFTFVGKDNVNAYVLNINGQEINIGNNTEYKLIDLVDKIPNIYNNVITCSVKSVGDGRVFEDSQYTAQKKFVKLITVENAYIENETLYFDAIKNVASYNVAILNNGQMVDEAKVVTNDTFDIRQLSLGLSELSVDGKWEEGANYTIKITPNIADYNAEVDGVFAGADKLIEYAIVGKVNSIIINDKTISWEFVKNAQTYNVQIFKDGVLVHETQDLNTNHLNIPYDEAGGYYCQVLAKSLLPNTTTAKEYSLPLYFDILEIPEITISDNIVSWSVVDNADGYLINIVNKDGVVLANQKFVMTNTYDVSAFDAGKYFIQVSSCGNGENGLSGKPLISSLYSENSTWTILNKLNVWVEDEKLCWQDTDESSLNRYQLKFDGVDIILNSNSYDLQYQYDEQTNMFTYDLSSHNFVPGNHEISIQSVAEGNVFDAEINTLEITKLEKGSIKTLSNKQFTINDVEFANGYRLEIYKLSDPTTSVMTLSDMQSGNKFNLDTTILTAGNYIAKVFALGNGENVFDADDTDLMVFEFEKLATPSVFIDGENLKLVVDTDSQVANAESYKIFENGVNKTLNDKEYLLNGLTAGVYNYTAQAIGNNNNVLDSDVTLTDNQIKIKKLTTPSLTFDKSSLTFTINCDDDQYVGNYKFTINGTDIFVSKTNKIADCSLEIVDAGNYAVELYAEPEVAGGEYALIIASEIKTHTVSKLNGLCDIKLSNGVLVVTPETSLVGTGYDLTLQIENGANDIVLNGFTYNGVSFEKRLQQTNYDIIEEIASLMVNGGDYLIFTTISQDNINVVTSAMSQCVHSLTVLKKVSTISKNGQTIEFEVIPEATNYIAVIKVDGNEYYIDLAGKYTTAINNVISMQNLLQLMDVLGLPYLEQTIYSISFVAVSDDLYTLANKGVLEYSFEFLKTPKLSVIEQENNTKYLAITNEDINTAKYQVVISQDMVLSEKTETKQNGDNTLICMDELTQIVAGRVIVYVHAMANSGNYFNSKDGTVNIEKLSSSGIMIVDGLLQWDVINNSKQYNLVYSNNTSSGTIVLTEGCENFTISGDKCVYNFDSLESYVSSLYLQVDALVKVGETYYLNSNNGPTFDSVYKLVTPVISVKDGKLYTEITNFDLDKTSKIEVKVNGVVVEKNIAISQEGVDIENDTIKLCITISPEILLAYGVDELLMEEITLKIYSNNNTTLNSSVGSKQVYGLLHPANLDIVTSKVENENGVINEVIEQITWDNPSANKDAQSQINLVSKYEIEIKYNKKDYTYYSTTRSFNMPLFDDKNEDGIKDEDEDEFGAGSYIIKVRALTNDCDKYVNSQFCEEITVVVLETPDDLVVSEGNISWSANANATYYLLKVYLITSNSQTLLVSTQSRANYFDLTTIAPFEEGVYGVTVQAMHDAPKILSSQESGVLQVVRLPQVEEYYIKDGALYIRTHKFFDKAEVKLTDKETGAIGHKFDIVNADAFWNMFEYAAGWLKWTDSNIISTYTNDDFFIDVKYQIEDDPTLSMLLAEDYKISVKLYGNSLPYSATEWEGFGVNIGYIISGHTSEHLINRYFADNNAVDDKNIIEKLVTPNIAVSSTERGVVLVNIPKAEYSLKYYVQGNNSLQGVHLYHLNILADVPHSLYVAQIVNNELLEHSIGGSITQDGEDKMYLKHFEYNGITFNVIDANNEGYIPFNFNANKYYYYMADGTYTYIDLDKGGEFATNVRFLGDDTIFAQSNITDIVKVKRYNVLGLKINQGVISWQNEATEDDHPMYLMELNGNGEQYNLVLYNPNVEYAEGLYYNEEYLLSCLDNQKQYIFDTITYSLDPEVIDKIIVYKGLAEIVDKTRVNAGGASGLGANFTASIKAYYTDSTSMDKILAQGAPNKTVAVLPEAKVIVNNGELTWNMSYLTGANGKEYIQDYLLQVFVGDSKQYEIELTTGMYNAISGVATYQLPQIINNGEDGNFTFTAGANYTFNIIALGGESTSNINSIVSSTGEISLLPYLENVRMEDGVLTWLNNTMNGVEIYVSYQLGDATITYKTTVYGDSFTLPTADRDDNGTYRYFTSGYTYYLRARIKGQSNSLSGFFNDLIGGEVKEENKIYATRLDTIDVNSIVTDGGELTWSANQKFENVKYIVEYTTADGDSYSTELLDTNYFDFGGVDNGVIKDVKVFAYHSKNFTSFASSTDGNGNEVSSKLIKLYKLDIPTNIKYHQGATIISWNKVKDDKGNDINNYRVQLIQDGIDIKEYNTSTNEWTVQGVVGSGFKVAIKAISVDNAGYLINSEYTEPVEMTIPNQVDASTFVYDDTVHAFKWQAIEGEQNADRYYISYNLTINSIVTPYDKIEITETRTIEGTKYYYYYPSIIGQYNIVRVQVERAGSLSSQPTIYIYNDGVLDFDIFTSGNGLNKNPGDHPYVISNIVELRNIKYRLNAEYVLGADITIDNYEPIVDGSQEFTGIINGEYGGTVHTIYGLKNENDDEITLFKNGNVGLFINVKGATFLNIILSGFHYSGYINAQTTNIGILAANAYNSTFQNITVSASTIKLIKSTTNGYGYINKNATIHVGVMLGYASNCVVNNSTINLGSKTNITAEIIGNANTTFAMGGIAGYATNGQFNNNTSRVDDNIDLNNAFIISVAITQEGSNPPTPYIGAIVGIGQNDVAISGNSCYFNYNGVQKSNEKGNI